MSGQVATTIVTAQIAAPKNGRRIQSEVPISPPTKSNARKVRVMSRLISAMESPFRLALASACYFLTASSVAPSNMET